MDAHRIAGTDQASPDWTRGFVDPTEIERLHAELSAMLDKIRSQRESVPAAQAR